MKYFEEKEFLMDGVIVFDKMDANLLKDLDVLRELVDEPLRLTSTYRDEDKNKAVGGSQRSQHLKGKAVDISCNNGTLRAKIVRHALAMGLTCGVAKTFVHVDNRSNQVVFSY
tara:strand:+ start:93 stop:431 length:339 start_codon:yes stop_codon:yes gene_type:complete